MNQFLQATEILGMVGRMLSASKSGYSTENPNNTVVFNSNVCTESQKIWFGDIDVTKDEAKLKALAEAIGEKVYVIREMDGRFENENKPLIDKAVYATQ